MLSHCLRCLLFLTLQRHTVNEKGKLDKVSKGRNEAASMDGGDGKEPYKLERRWGTIICTTSRYLGHFCSLTLLEDDKRSQSLLNKYFQPPLLPVKPYILLILIVLHLVCTSDMVPLTPVCRICKLGGWIAGWLDILACIQGFPPWSHSDFPVDSAL